MENPEKNKKRWLIAGFILLLVLAGSVFIVINKGNSFGKSPQSVQDPREGIKEWIDAMNTRDFARLYALSPESIQKGIDVQGFTRAQAGNPLFAEGSRISEFQVLNQSFDGNTTTITALIVMTMPSQENSTTENIPIQIKFIEIFEHGSWRVWAT